MVNSLLTHTQIVGLSRIELLTSRLSGVRSNHLSYRPSFFLDNKKSSEENWDEIFAWAPVLKEQNVKEWAPVS